MSADTYQLWAEIYDASYTTKLGLGPVRLTQATSTQELNGVGTGGINTIPMHPDFTIRALDLLNSKVIVEVWTQTPGTSKRKVTAFIADSVSYSHQTGGVTLNVDGPDTMNLLTNTSTLIAREYSNTNHASVVEELLTLAGWTLQDDGLSTLFGYSIRFDGQSILQAVKFISENNDYRMRVSDTVNKQLVMGEGVHISAVRVGFAKGDKPAIRFNDETIIVDNIEIVDDSKDAVNWILPIGAGDGDAALTLEKSTRNSPYTIQTTTGPDGRTLYYLSDSTSITSYGQIERRVNFKQIAPLGTSTISQRDGANILYDAASQWLTTHKDPQQILVISARNLNTPLFIGDKIRVQYVETVNHSGQPYTMKNIDADYWIIATNESLGSTGSTVRLTVSNTDRVVNTDGKIIVGGLDAIEVNSIAFKPIYNIWTMGPYADWISSANLPIFTLVIPSDVLSVTNVTMIVHTYSDRQQTIPSTPYAATLNFFQAQSNYPYDIDISVNSIATITGLGVDNTDQILGDEFDITDEILAAGNDGRGSHTIQVTDQTFGGEIRVQFMIRGVITTGATT